MELKIRCGSCGKLYRVPERLAGKTLKCKACGAAIAVPAPKPKSEGTATKGMDLIAALGPSTSSSADDTIAPLPVDFPQPAARAKTSGGGSGNHILLLAGGAAAVVILGIVAVVAVLMFLGVARPDQGVGRPTTPIAQDTRDDTKSLPLEQASAIKTLQSDIRQQRFSERSKRPGGSPLSSRGGGSDGMDLDDKESGPLGVWQAGPDPAPQDRAFEISDSVSFRISADPDDIVFTDLDSPYIVVKKQGQQNGGWDVIDLRAGKRVGGLDKSPTRTQRVIVTPDGRLLVVRAGTFENATVHVFDAKSQRKVTQFPLAYSVQTPRMRIPDQDTLLLLTKGHVSTSVKISNHDLRTGEERWSVDAPQDTELASAKISPGGRYLALAIKGLESACVLLIETATGNHVGRLRVGNGAIFGCDGLAFSPDGTRLAGAFQNLDDLYVWDLRDGQRTSYVNIKKFRLRHREGIEWIGHSPTVMIAGQEMIDTKTGRKVGPLPGIKGPSKPSRCVIGGKYLLTTTSQGDNAQTVSISPLAEAQEKADLNYGLPPATELDASAVRYIGATDNPPTAWNIQPDPTPGVGQDLLREPIALRIPEFGENAQCKLLPARSGNGRALLGIFEQVPRRHIPIATYLVDLTGQAPPTRLPESKPRQPMAISPDGTHALFKTGDARVDLYQLEPFKHIRGWNIPKRHVSHVIRSALLVSNNRFWVNCESRVLLISAADSRVLGVSLYWSRLPFKTTPGGRYIIREFPNLYLLDAQSGQTVAALPIEYPDISGTDVSPDGRRLACLYSPKDGGQRLVLFDLSTGAMTASTPLSGTGIRPPRWTGNRFLLADKLLDPNNGQVLWLYYGDQFDHGGIDERVWAYTPDHENRRITLNAYTLPHGSAKRAMAEREAAQPLIGPGTHVRLRFAGLADQQAQQQRLEEFFTDAGLVVADDGQYTFNVERSIKSTRQEYRAIGGEKKHTANIRHAETTWSWTDNQGNVLWRTKTRKNQGGPIARRQGESVQQAINRKDIRDAGNVYPPTRLLPKTDRLRLGRTKLTGDGPIDDPRPDQPNQTR